MQSYQSWLRQCVKHKLTLEQMMFLYMIKMKDFVEKNSWGNQYIAKVQKFSVERVIVPVIEREYVLNLNTAGNYYPEFLVISESADGIFATYQMGEELWESYPKLLPLSGGSNFVSRAGIEKDDLIETYLRRIEHSPEKHVDVMQRLVLYEQQVRKGAMNGAKIGDFVKQSLWEVVNIDKPHGSFGRQV